MVLTDHSPRLTVANGLSAARLEQQLEEVSQLNVELAPFRILTGIEVDILSDGALDQDPALLARLDLVVGSVHSELRMDEKPMTRRLVTALADPNLDILGHMTGRMLTRKRRRPPSAFDAEIVFAAALRFDKAIEINSRPERLDPPKRILRLAVEAGCRFAIDSDAHAPGQLAWLPFGCDRAWTAILGACRTTSGRDTPRAWRGCGVRISSGTPATSRTRSPHRSRSTGSRVAPSSTSASSCRGFGHRWLNERRDAPTASAPAARPGPRGLRQPEAVQIEIEEDHGEQRHWNDADREPDQAHDHQRDQELDRL